MSLSTIPITVAFGDGIGPEIMNAVMYLLKEAEAPIRIETIEIGEKLYNKKYTSGISEEAWRTIQRNKILLKAPITTPQGGGYKSLNVTLRKSLGLFANIRPSKSFYPFVETLHPNMDVVVVRENEEDIYAGIEYRQTQNTYESIKLISRLGSERIIRYAFEYAMQNNRQKVTCFSKDNIMKFTDGLFHKVFKEVSREYKDIKSDHQIIDIATARVASRPEDYDVIVTSNLYGDIVSDVTAELSGSVGLAGSANIGEEYAMFEAIHGSAPDIAGQDLANPTGLINAAVMMLVHCGLGKEANLIENALKCTIEEGIHTSDIYKEHKSAKKVGTMEFAREVAERFGKLPSQLEHANYSNFKRPHNFGNLSLKVDGVKTLVGVDVFIDMPTEYPKEIAEMLKDIDTSLKVKTIASKGLMLWPREGEVKFTSDHWCIRFMPESGEITHNQISQLLIKLAEKNIDYIKVENLYEFDNERGYSLNQGE